MTGIRTDFTPEEALNYVAANEAIRSGDVRKLAQLLAENPELVHIRVIRNRTLFNQLADWPGRWPRRLESAALLIGAAAPKLARQLRGAVPLVESGTLEAAIHYGYRNGHAGDTVLLAPACASFDQFRSFEHRGEVFKQIVTQLEREN